MNLFSAGELIMGSMSPIMLYQNMCFYNEMYYNKFPVTNNLPSLHQFTHVATGLDMMIYIKLWTFVGDNCCVILKCENKEFSTVCCVFKRVFWYFVCCGRFWTMLCLMLIVEYILLSSIKQRFVSNLGLTLTFLSNRICI